MALVQLPQCCGNGYYSYETADRQFGTEATIQTLLEIGETFRLNMPETSMGIGDISFAEGGKMSPHHSHQDGTNVDVRPCRLDKAQHRVSIHDKQYDRVTTQLLVDSFLAHKNVRRILFNDAKIKGVHPWAGHDNHLHVIMKK